METVPFLLYLQQPATWLYPELEESNLQPSNSFN